MNLIFKYFHNIHLFCFNPLKQRKLDGGGCEKRNGILAIMSLHITGEIEMEKLFYISIVSLYKFESHYCLINFCKNLNISQ